MCRSRAVARAVDVVLLWLQLEAKCKAAAELCPHILPLGCPLQVKAFDESAHSLSLHPTGYLLLAGFADKLRLMTVLSGGWGC